MPIRRTARAGLALAILAIVVWFLAPYWTSLALILRAAQIPGWPGTAARWNARSVSDSIEQISIRDGSIRARVYRPSGTPERAAMLVSGVHPDGIDEPRLTRLARELAATGTIVVTPEIEDLLHYRLTSRVTDTIEDAARWMLSRGDLSGAGRLGLIGVSFSGGLVVVAAGRPAVRDRIAYVLSFGGHGNLARVMRYLCTGNGSRLAPHDYALAVLLHQTADLLVPVDQVALLQVGIEEFLDASATSRARPGEADRIFARSKELQREVPEPAATLLREVNDRDVVALGRRLSPFLDRLGQDPALSPDRSPPPIAPVFLLHGADDNVIPAEESDQLAKYLEGKTRVRQLKSRFLTHADVADRPTASDTWEMVAYWKSVLDSR
jgi:dienelactone hydrolase